jgi:hypothetical protein
MQKHIREKNEYAVTQMVCALRYKPERCGFDSRAGYWNFSLKYSFRPHHDPWVDSAANRNDYQEYSLGDKAGRCVGLTPVPPSCTDCLNSLGYSPCPVLYWDTFKGRDYINIWVRVLQGQIHLGLANGPFVPHNLISAQWSPVLC